MIVERITDLKEVTSILKIDDPYLEKQVLSRLKCSKAEWVQYIVSYIPNEEFMGLWAVKEDENIKAYMIAVNAVAPPISRSVIVLYQTFFGMKDEDGSLLGLKAIEKIKEWATEKGAINLVIQTDKPHVNSRIGFVKDNVTSMTMEL